MIRRLLALLMVYGLCFGPAANAADVPAWAPEQKTTRVKQNAKPKKVASRPKAVVAAPKKVAAKPVPASPLETPDEPPLKTPDENQQQATRNVEAPAEDNEFDMVWVLDPLVANADGSKMEDSASVEGNLIVVEPGYVSLPYMVIELSGHIVKTPDTTARLDIKIGGSQRTVNWKADDIQAGKFKLELKAPMKEGKLPAYFPVSALAFVTKEGKQGAAMVSLDKIVVRVGKVSVANAQ